MTAPIKELKGPKKGKARAISHTSSTIGILENARNRNADW